MIDSQRAMRVATAMGMSLFFLGVVILASCSATTPTPTPAPSPTPSPDNLDLADVTFGAEQPSAEEVDRRPQAINPYAANASAELPASADLTEYLPPIGDQGELGSCTAWAAGYASATYTANRQYGWGATSSSHQASPGYLYNTLIAVDSLPCGSGTYITTAVDLLVSRGCSSLATVAYMDDQCIDSPDEDDAGNFRVGSYNRVVQTDRNAVKGELAAGRIIVFGAELYDDFLQFTGDDVYTGSGRFLTEGNLHAAHAMALVGYDDSRGAYRIMNSWSTLWGDRGFAWMDYDTFEATAFEAYSIESSNEREPTDPEPDPDPSPDPDPTPTPDQDPEGYLDDAYQFADVDPITGDPLVYLVFFYHFDSPVLIHSVTVTDPIGDSGEQIYEQWFLDGYVYFVLTGGYQWIAGDYTLEFDTTTRSGNDILYTGVATIDPLDGGDSGTGLCTDTCLYAYDGECDDGGPGSDYSVCDYGTDCFDCGERDTDTLKSAKPIKSRTFRGIPVKLPAAAQQLPAAGVQAGALGANRHPAMLRKAEND